MSVVIEMFDYVEICVRDMCYNRICIILGTSEKEQVATSEKERVGREGTSGQQTSVEVGRKRSGGTVGSVVKKTSKPALVSERRLRSAGI